MGKGEGDGIEGKTGYYNAMQRNIFKNRVWMYVLRGNCWIISFVNY